MVLSDEKVGRQNTRHDDLLEVSFTVISRIDTLESAFKWILKGVVGVSICVPMHGTLFERPS